MINVYSVPVLVQLNIIFFECDQFLASRQQLFDVSKQQFAMAIEDEESEFVDPLDSINFYDLDTFCFPPKHLGEEYWYPILKECINMQGCVSTLRTMLS